MRRTVVCGDGLMRTGTVIYIGETFETLEFKGRGGNWRESFYRPIPEERLAGSLRTYRKPMKGRLSPDEIKMLEQPLGNRELAKLLGRDEDGIARARRIRGIRRAK